MMIKKSIKIHIFKILVYLDPFCEFFLSHQLKLLKNQYFQKFRFILNLFDKESFFMKSTFEINTKIEIS